MAKILSLLMLGSLLGPVQQSLTFSGGLANLSPSGGCDGFYLGVLTNPSVLSGLLDVSPLATLISWSAASVIMFCLAMSTSYHLILWKMAELDLVSHRGSSADIFRRLRFLRHLLAGFFSHHRMLACRTVLKFINHFEAAPPRQLRLAIDRTSHAYTIPDRWNRLSTPRRVTVNNFGCNESTILILREEQIRESSSNISTESRKQLPVGRPIPLKRNIDAISLTSEFEDLLRRRRLNDYADQSRYQCHVASIPSQRPSSSIWNSPIAPQAPTLAEPTRNCWREGRRDLSTNALRPSLNFEPVSIGTAYRRYSNPHKNVTFVRPQKNAAGRLYDGEPLLKWMQGREYSKWRDSKPNSILWLRVIPGSGKSTLANNILHDLHNRSETRNEGWYWGADYGVYYNAATHLRRVHFDTKVKRLHGSNTPDDGTRGSAGKHWSPHVKERIDDLEAIVQPPQDISSLMDEPGPVAIVGLSPRLHSAESADHLWDMLLQTSKLDSRVPESRFDMLERDFDPRFFKITPIASESRDLVQTVYDILEAAWPSHLDSMDISSEADLLQQQFTRLAYDASPLTIYIYGSSSLNWRGFPELLASDEFWSEGEF